MIEVEAVSKSYADSVRVLNGVTFTLPEGKYGVIVGRSGSGKSTLLSIIGGLESADSGTVRIGGLSMSGSDPDARAAFRLAHMGIVFQFFNLLPTLTIRENAALPAALLGTGRAEALRRAERWLTRVGLGPIWHRLPHEVSGGEIQRAAIARAFVNDPSVILADEPTGNLDGANGAEVLALFHALSRETNATVLVVTHDPLLEQGADCVFRITDGTMEP